MQSLYQCDLAYVQAAAFGTLAQGAATEIICRLRSTTAPVRKVLDVGCGAGVLTKALTDARFEVTGGDTSGDLLEFARTSAVQIVRVLDLGTMQFAAAYKQVNEAVEVRES
jgi:2-polyprenyl-3-methyl-5-hydroxy-6-metoxy-1,4-benzoquinol methylase